MLLDQSLDSQCNAYFLWSCFDLLLNGIDKDFNVALSFLYQVNPLTEE